jgi:predicted dehydrogenase/threonine dehydrogenase-like Zn-dependent dehydrogenase
MRQLLQNIRTGETLVAEVPIPTPRPKTALVHNVASLVSAGTERMVVDFAEKSLLGKARSRPDLVMQLIDKARREGVLTTVDAAFNRLDQPMVLGYSSAGVVVAVGEGLQGFQVGDRVACAGGGYAVHAEYVTVPQNLLAKLPPDLDFESAAFTTIGAIAMHGFRLGMPQVGERVAIIGLGLLGLLSIGIARSAGCSVLGVDLDERRVELARQMGVKAVLRPEAEEACQSFSQGDGCDLVLICADTSSGDPVYLAGKIARDRGRVVAVGAVGLDIPRKLYYEKELSFLISRSYGPGRYDPDYEENGKDYPLGYVRWTEGRNLQAVVDLLADGRLDVHPLITHHYDIAQAPEAYELITGKRNEPFLGVLLTYPQTQEDVSRSVPTEAEYIQNNRVKPVAGGLALGVIGAGNFASAMFLPSIRRIASIDRVGIASASGLNARHTAQRYGFRYASADAEQIITDPQINVVAILTRHNLHAPLVVKALQAGKHVFCEKPLALNLDELDQVIAVLKRCETLLTVGFNRRFAPFAVQLKKFISQSQEPLLINYRVNAGYLPPSHWLHDSTQGGGRIIGEGCHFVDFLTFLTGSLPINVSAQSLPDGGVYHEDNVILNFTFGNGSIGSVSYFANSDKSFPKERVEVFGGGRAAVLDDFRSLQLTLNGKTKKMHSYLRQDKGHLAVLGNFFSAIQNNGDPPVPYDQLIGVTKATFMAVEAIRTHERIEVS